MKTRGKTRKFSQKHCLCECDNKHNVSVKSPGINMKNSRNIGKVNRKSTPTKTIIKKVNTNENLKKQILNNTNNDKLSPVVILKKSISPIKETNRTNGKILKKQPYVVVEQINVKSPKMKLRRNRQKNYCEPPSLHVESIHEKSIDKPTTIEKIPIYKQQIQDTKKKKTTTTTTTSDMYEFDSDSEETTRKKRKQRKLNDSSHDEYNKTIENILRKVATKIKERKHSPVKKANDNNNNQKSTEPLKQPNKKVQNNKTRNDGKQITKKTRFAVKNTNDSSKPLPIITNNAQHVAIKDAVSTSSKPLPIVTNNPQSVAIKDAVSTSSKPLPIVTNNPQPVAIKDAVSTSSKPLPITANKVQNVAIKDVLSTPSKFVPNSNDNDDTFGFLDDVDDDNNRELIEISMNQSNRTPKIHIISNIKLKPNQQLIFSDKTINLSPIIRPNANSTMIQNNVLTPWRFNEINIRRNPHLIQVKHSALPSISQEPVMEYSIIEKLLNSSTPQHQQNNDDDVDVDIDKNEKNSILQTPILRRSPRKFATPSIQKTLDDYYGDKNVNKENRCVTRQSLFDIDDLSPIKIDENHIKSPIKKVNSIKRQILGNLTGNENIIGNVQITTPNLSNKTDTNQDMLTYFGFETSKESNDNSNVDNDKVKDNRPYRLSINVNDKKYEVKRKARKLEEEEEEKEEKEEVEAKKDLPDRINSDDEDDDDNDVKSDLESLDGAGLFEDLHDAKDKEEIKLKKKRKVKWLQTDNEKPKKRRKDIRTRKEEEEAERWAEQFNSMCKEVEEFPLEIE